MPERFHGSVVLHGLHTGVPLGSLEIATDYIAMRSVWGTRFRWPRDAVGSVAVERYVRPLVYRHLVKVVLLDGRTATPMFVPWRLRAVQDSLARLGWRPARAMDPDT